MLVELEDFKGDAMAIASAFQAASVSQSFFESSESLWKMTS
jgi:hypothetical protein